MKINRFFTGLLILSILICSTLMPGCASKTPELSDTELKKTFAGDASKMPESAKKQIEAMKQQAGQQAANGGR